MTARVPPPLHRQQTDLPIEQHAPAITDGLAAGSLVLTAEPGAGKTSIVPLLAAEFAAGTVLLVQPRRLAATAAATRLAALTDPPGAVGHHVGVTIRGDRRVGPLTVIEVMTEAVLTNRLHRDAELPGVSTLVFDEFHERNLHSDLAFAMALEARATLRPDLTIVVMSATIDPHSIADHVAANTDPQAPEPCVLTLPGRTFPVETHYLHRPPRARWADEVAATARQVAQTVTGDVLVFVPGRREIDDVVGQLGDLARAGKDVIGLHGGSEASTRAVVLSDSGPQRIVVATAVAESSVTLPRVEAVVDGGLERRARFDAESGLGRLETGYVNQFSAEQRRGRAGRTRSGHCYRLWSQEDHRHLELEAKPEIVVGDPATVAFELARWGDPHAESLPLLTAPGQARTASGIGLLAGLGLVDDDGRLTDRGKQAGRLGVHPRLGALVLAAADGEFVSLGGPAPVEVGARVAALIDLGRVDRRTNLVAVLESEWRSLASPAQRILRRVGQGHKAQRRDGSGGANESRRPEHLDQLVAAMLTRAWPDRVARRIEPSPSPNLSGNRSTGRPDPGLRFQVAAGRVVVLPRRAESELQRSEFLVVVEAGGTGDQLMIHQAVPVDRATVMQNAAHAIESRDEVTWDVGSGVVKAERLRQLGAIVLHREPISQPDPAQVQTALGEGIRRHGLSVLPWNGTAEQLRARMAWLHEQAPDTWPAVDDEALLGRMHEWLDLSQCRRPSDIGRLRVADGLLTLLDWKARRQLDELAPVERQPPKGRPRRISYETGRPVWSVRVQQLLGLDRHPLVGPNQVPLTIELLTPADRPAQVTNDLPGFWRGSYTAVRAELRGRYPKHAWPEDPTAG